MPLGNSTPLSARCLSSSLDQRLPSCLSRSRAVQHPSDSFFFFFRNLPLHAARSWPQTPSRPWPGTCFGLVFPDLLGFRSHRHFHSATGLDVGQRPSHTWLSDQTSISHTASQLSLVKPLVGMAVTRYRRSTTVPGTLRNTLEPLLTTQSPSHSLASDLAICLSPRIIP